MNVVSFPVLRLLSQLPSPRRLRLVCCKFRQLVPWRAAPWNKLTCTTHGCRKPCMVQFSQTVLGGGVLYTERKRVPLTRHPCDGLRQREFGGTLRTDLAALH